jgi:predicted secreted hydrolase
VRFICNRCVLVSLVMSATWPWTFGCCPEALYELLTPNPVVRLPLDEAPHCNGSEWWYYTGRVMTDRGRGYGIEAVIFHTTDLPPMHSGEAWIAHYAVLDETTGDFNYDQQIWMATADSSSSSPGFHLVTPLVQMRGYDGHDQLQAAMADDRFAVNLQLVDEHGPILHGGTGYVDYGVSGHSFYYSRPDMRATGTLLIDDSLENVTGTLWFDRQWGQDLNDPWLQWDWFSLRLDDGSNVMVFVFRDSKSPVAMGTYVPPVGQPSTLHKEDFSITPKTFWTSPHTDVRYPTSWEIQIVPQNMCLTVTAVAPNQEFDARMSTMNIYWEGLCTVNGTCGNEPVAGDAYVEMTNR